MNKLYGTMIIFFYFIKYPLVIGLPIFYLYFEIQNNWILNILWLVSVTLISKDWFFSHKNSTYKSKNKR